MRPCRPPRRTMPSSLAYHRPMDEPDAHDAATDPTTPAIEAVAAAGVPHRIVRTERASSAEESARFQGIETRQLLRTIVVRRGDDDYLFVLVPAGRRFDWPKLRTLLEVRRMSLPDADEARAVTGYERYTITPFGSTRPWPVIADATIVDEPVVAIGGGGFGVNLHLAPVDLVRALDAQVADVSVPEPPHDHDHRDGHTH
jgi:Cys-tRNA(Pro)/Cys-tRNA(Cys) deacylase